MGQISDSDSSQSRSVGTETIDLSPINEGTLSKSSRINKVDFEYVQRINPINGRKTRVGFKQRTKEWGKQNMARLNVAHPLSPTNKPSKVEYNAVHNGRSTRDRLKTISQVDEESDSYVQDLEEEESESQSDTCSDDGLSDALERLTREMDSGRESASSAGSASNPLTSPSAR